MKSKAEGVGFEPTRAHALPVFKTGAFNRSATPPQYSARHLYRSTDHLGTTKSQTD